MFKLFHKLRNHHENNNEELLHHAASIGDVNLLENMLAAGTNIECKKLAYCATPLHTAINCGQLQIVKRLLAHQANFTATDRFGFTPLATAAFRGKVEIAKVLLDAGADLETKTGSGAVYGETTPLGLAAFESQLSMVALLLDRGANVNAVCLNGRTPLINAVGRNDSSAEVVAKLLEKGANVNAQTNDGRTALMGAVLARHGNIVKLLLQHGANPSLKDKDGETAFSFAHNRFNDETCLKILNHHVNTRHRHQRRHHHVHQPDSHTPISLRK